MTILAIQKDIPSKLDDQTKIVMAVKEKLDKICGKTEVFGDSIEFNGYKGSFWVGGFIYLSGRAKTTKTKTGYSINIDGNYELNMKTILIIGIVLAFVTLGIGGILFIAFDLLYGGKVVKEVPSKLEAALDELKAS